MIFSLERILSGSLLLSDNCNSSMFWLCDYGMDGKSFELRHMMCAENRVFEPLLNECILIGTTRDIRQESNNHNNGAQRPAQSEIQLAMHSELSLKFTCNNLTVGKYLDTKDCHVYHVCLSNNYLPYNQLTFLCPNDLSYDPISEKCNRLASHRCQKDNSMSVIESKHKNDEMRTVSSEYSGVRRHCESETRFRVEDTCHGYFLCYGDQMMRMECPESFEFDEDSLECQPGHTAKCNRHYRQEISHF